MTISVIIMMHHIKIFYFVLVFCFWTPLWTPLGTPLCLAKGHDLFVIGSALEDITGPAVERPFMGYGNTEEVGKGIHTRLRSRAFVIELPQSNQLMAIVIVDLGLVFAEIKTAVLKNLEVTVPGKFKEANLLISATHTHAGPGGFSHHDIFNFPTLGFDQKNFDVIVDGITKSVLKAYHNRASGNIRINEGRLLGASKNRSLPAYYANKDWKNFEYNIDPTSLVLRFTQEPNQEIGLINWFAVHATCMSNRNHLVSADNKGRAAEFFEREMNTHAKTFVAAFANANEGDSAPPFEVDSKGNRKKDLLADFILTEENGFKQYAKAKELFENALLELSPQLRYRSVWVHMPLKACNAAMGYSFAAGADDGPSDIPGLFEGMKQDETIVAPPLEGIALFLRLLLGGSTHGKDCHRPKIILMATDPKNPDLLPETLPFQLLVIGSLAIAGVPGEMTTMAGRRLKKLLIEELAPLGVNSAMISAISNDYSGYVTTPEEYQEQNYEGGFTLFGPQTLRVYLETFSKMAKSMKEGKEVFIDDPRPARKKPLKDYLSQTQTDGKKFWEKFGDVLSQPHSHYLKGDTIVVKFRSANPRNSLKLLDHFIEVRRLENQTWVPVFIDGDKETRFFWNRERSRDCAQCSRVKFLWETDFNTPVGTYRIHHFGYSKSGEALHFFEGVTREFYLDP